MRARYYDSASGRFISRDPVKGIGPKSINPYQYALGNPKHYSDPTGNLPLPPITMTDDMKLRILNYIPRNPYPPAIGPSSTYTAQFEVIEEIEVMTDPLPQITGGIGINIVTGRGTNRFRGGGPKTKRKKSNRETNRLKGVASVQTGSIGGITDEITYGDDIPWTSFNTNVNDLAQESTCGTDVQALLDAVFDPKLFVVAGLPVKPVVNQRALLPVYL